MTITRYAVAVAAIVAGGLSMHLCAAELPAEQIGDIRLDVGVVPASRNVTESSAQPATGLGQTATVGGLDLGLRVDLGIYKAIGPLEDTGTLVIGLGIFDAQQSGASNTGLGRYGLVGPVEVNAIGADLSFSYALSLTHGWHIEIGPFAGIGTASVTDRSLVVGSTTNSTVVGGHGVYREYGGRLSIFYTSANNNFLVHLGIAYYGAHAGANFSFAAQGGTVNENIAVDETGISPSLGFGYRF